MAQILTQIPEVMLAAALCEGVYRRADVDQQVTKVGASGITNTEGFSGLVSGQIIAQTDNIPGFKQDGGFYYNDATGFVGQIIQAGGKVYVVYRGSDLSDSFWSAAPAFFAGKTEGDRGAKPTTADPQDFGNNRRLGEGTVTRTQLTDALALLEAAKQLPGAAGNIIVTGQSLGGGLAVSNYGNGNLLPA